MTKKKIFFTSDLHIGLKHIIKLDKSHFSNIEQMEKTIIENWNKKVSNDDIVYILGDLFYREIYWKDYGAPKGCKEFLKKLKGRKVLVRGNHDRWITEEEFGEFFEKICDIDYIVVDGTKCCLFHYPLLDWEGRGKGVLNLFGHMHNNHEKDHKIAIKRGAYNVGVAVNNYEPVTLEEVIENNKILLETRNFKNNR
ncbi:MAG: metallophosphoesterase [Sarcina sp.]